MTDDATPRQVAEAIHAAERVAAEVGRAMPSDHFDRVVKLVIKAFLAADSVALLTYLHNTLRGDLYVTTISEWLAVIGPVATLILGWFAGHRAQLKALAKAAAELGPDARELFHEIKAAAKATK